MKANKLCVWCNLEPVSNYVQQCCKKCYPGLRKYGLLIERTELQSRAITIMNIRKNYGLKFIGDLFLLNTKHYWNLSRMGEKYNISRERIRQIYKKLFKRPYTVFKIKKSEIRQESNALVCKNDPRYKAAEYKKGNVKIGAEAELLFFEKCILMGFDIKIPCSTIGDILVNGLLIDVKSSAKSVLSKGSKIPQYHYASGNYQSNFIDYYALYHLKRKSFFIVPNLHKGKNKKWVSYYIKEKPSPFISAKNKIFQYENAWGLLYFDYRNAETKKDWFREFPVSI